VSQLNLPQNFADVIEKDIQNFNPVQLETLKAGLLDLKDSFVIASPTASGKTLIAELLMVKAILERRTKALYIVPLRALANEKFSRFKSKYEQLGIKVTVSTGDFDSSDMWLQNYDLIVLTSEKTDSLLRHKAPFLSQVGVVVVDECHLITDVGRGPTLEVTITRLRKLNPATIFLMLSATIANAEELAAWLKAKLVKSDFRPVKLHEGVYFDSKIWFEESPAVEINGDEMAEILIAEDTVKMNKQAIIFASSRRNAEAIAERCSKAVKKLLNSGESLMLEGLSKSVLETLEHSTPQCKRLAECIKGGVAFHHAGLAGKQRLAIEDAFRNRQIKIIAATPTLAAGVDLPAYRVLIRDARRYYPGAGFIFIPVLEYEQMRGRAGRPRYDKEGQSILLAHSESEARELYNRFVLGEPEKIQSKLAVEPVLRMHVLALIATDVVSDETEIENFFAKTFWGHQFKDISFIKEKLAKILKQLVKWEFISPRSEGYVATKLGKRVSELYIDPLSAHKFIEAIQRYQATDFGILQMLSNSRELAPQLKVRKKDFDIILNELSLREHKLMTNVPKEWDLDYDDFLDSVKTALAFEDWASEAGEDLLYKKYNLTPGELHSKREIVDWLLYTMDELSGIIGKPETTSLSRKLRIRMHYGVKEELLQLIKLKGIGRIRARLLWNNNFKTLNDVRNANPRELSLILGIKTAESVKEQLQSNAF